MFITSDPKDKVYKDLLDLAFSVCDEFILVVRSSISIFNNVTDVLEKLYPFLKEKKEQSEWPGTKYFGKKSVIVYYYKTDEEAKRILLKFSNSLHSWVQPNLPEDLCFLKNQKPWLINTAHERASYFDTDDKDEIEKIMNVENLTVRKLNSLNHITQLSFK